eukprot:scaffold3856_cov169-Amphora_coffeaeformis.AAC.3
MTVMRKYRHCCPPVWRSKRTITFLIKMIHPWILIALILLTVRNGLADMVDSEKKSSSSSNKSHIMILLGRHEDWIHAQIYETPGGNPIVAHTDSIKSLVCGPLISSLQQALPQYQSNVICEDSQLVDLRPFRLLHPHTTTNYFVPLASWTVHLRIPTRVGWIPPPLPSEYATADWKFYAWDEASALGQWWDAAVTSSLETSASTAKTGPTFRAIAHILVVLPPDLFLNIEDAIETPPGSLLKQFRVLDVPPGRVIDQEEPAFVSQSHGVLLQIEFPAQEEFLEVQWVLLLHTRYPKPLQQADFSLLAMIPPAVWSLQVVRDDDSAVVDVPWTWGKPDSTPHYIWVAAGRQEDFVPVMTITTLVAMVGCGVMLRALAKTTRSLG